jgi:hypothetical protein
MERKFKIPPVLQITPPMIFQRDRTRFPSISAMCATNKLERSIATLVVVRNTMLRLVYATDFEIMLKWLSSIKFSEQKFMTSVKKIQLCYKRATDFIETHMSFVIKCSTLANLIVSIPNRELWITILREAPLVQELPKCLTCDQVVKKFGLDLIAECAALTRLTFHIPFIMALLGSGHFAIADLDQVADWCKKAFMKAHGRALVVELVWSSDTGQTKTTKVGITPVGSLIGVRSKRVRLALTTRHWITIWNSAELRQHYR